MNKYKCKYCGKSVKRKSSKKWIKSFCSQTGKNVHLLKQDPWMDIVKEVNKHFKVDKSLLQ